MIISVVVVPGSGRQRIEESEEGLKVWLKSPADKGKANKELVKLLSKHFGKTARIKSGLTSKKKRIEVMF